MSPSKNSRRQFLRNVAYAACSGGAAALFPQMRMIGAALANTRALPGYKALVCVNLSGGNDSWNLLMPFDTPRYDVYAAARGGVYNAQSNGTGLALALPLDAQIALQKIVDGSDANAATNPYFVHPQAVALADIYRQNKLAFVVNAGPLKRPITMADYADPTKRPAQLFSHKDQTDFWHQANTNATNVGWGGRCGDLLGPGNANTTLSSCISIGGDNRFQNGVSTSPYQLSTNGLSGLAGMCNPTPCSNAVTTSRDTALNALLDEAYASDFATEYSATFKRGRELYALIKADLDATSVATTFPDTSLGAQLKMVARMIKLSKARNYASRQIYYVDVRGFDLHAGLMTGAHAGLLRQVSEGVAAFWNALAPADVDAQNEVTLFSTSEFARTLQSNGSGSDHGWGGVQFVAGGAVAGGKLYADGSGPIRGFPDQHLNAPNNFARGQMIPGIGVDQYAATLAQWLGVTSPGDLAAVFPNLSAFGSGNLGFV